MIKALALFSGGLDSILAVKIIQDQGIEVLCVTFSTPFFLPDKALAVAQEHNFNVRVIDLTDKLLDVMRAPKYGFGKGVNPCIDCHSLMFRETGRIMEEEQFDFMFSGEVLGERPMSQNKNSLKIVEKYSGYQGYILRPLSAKLLEETVPEKTGQVDREKLLDIQGRTRKPQYDLAEKYSLKTIPTPAGGCKLTEPNYSHRFKQLIDLSRPNEVNKRYVKLLSVGRHFLTEEKNWFIIGRNEKENDVLYKLASEQDLKFYVKDYNGPICLLVNTGVEFTQEIISFVASACVRYSDAPKDEIVDVCVGTEILQQKAVDDKILKQYLV